MSESGTASTAVTTGAHQRPRRRYLLARILLDGGFGVVVFFLLAAFGLNGGAGYQPLLPVAIQPTAVPQEHGLRPPIAAPVEAVTANSQRGNLTGVALAGSQQEAVVPFVVPRPLPPAPLRPTVLAALSAAVVGLLAMLAGFAVAEVSALTHRHGPDQARSPSTTKSRRRAV